MREWLANWRERRRCRRVGLCHKHLTPLNYFWAAYDYHSWCPTCEDEKSAKWVAAREAVAAELKEKRK